MQPNVNPIKSHLPKGEEKIYVPVIKKFWISHGVALLWMLFSIYVSLPWLRDFANIVPFPVALLVITGICYVPGYMNAFLVIMPFLDFTFTFFWLPGLVLALFGYYWIVGPMTLLVLPLTLLSYTILYFFQKKYVFKPLNLKVRKNEHGFILFVLFYQILMSPVSCYGYIQEFLKFKRKWK